MPGGTFAKPFNRARSFRDVRLPAPRKMEQTMRCPVENKPFDRYAVIELMETEHTGEIQYYCPHCDELVVRESVSCDRRTTEILDPGHT